MTMITRTFLGAIMLTLKAIGFAIIHIFAIVALMYAFFALDGIL